MGANQFDPGRSRELLLGSCGYEWSLRAEFAEAKAVGGLASTADANLGTAIECSLVGFDEPAGRLLKQAAEWVQVAIETDERPERYFPGATEAIRFQTLALCNWFLFNEHDTVSLQRFVEHEDLYLNSQTRKDKVGVSLTLLTYVNAGAFKRTLEIFEGTPGLSAPTTLSPRNEAEMAYIVSRHRLHMQYSQDEVQTATTKFLAKNVDKWLSNGHWVRVAEWMKILYWNDADRELRAKQVLMKCYDYLPGRRSPE